MRDPSRSVLLVTHYQRLLDIVKPDYVHVLADGEIKLSGDFTLAERLEREGYEGIEAA
jgi:ABC-type transport system involved in Fe-S cluster assembly, ATPase component